MEVSKRYHFALPRSVLWDRLMDVHFVATHLDGVEALDDLGDDRYEGTLHVKMGPVGFRFKGDVVVTERDLENWTGVLQATAKDRKTAGGFKASLVMKLSEPAPADTELAITLDTSFVGRIGEFGRPLIKKKIGSMMDTFAANVRKDMTPES